MIRLENVHKAFKAPVLKGVNLEVGPGGIFALIGPGATGKSVLFKLIAGLLRPDEGSITVDGQNLGELDEIGLAKVRQGIGYLFQNYALFEMSVADNIAFPLRRAGETDESVIAQKVAERLARVSLPGREEQDPASMSGGQKKRVGVARATIAKAPIVLYDEPTAGLDPVTSKKIYNLIKEEQRLEDTTVLVISSDVSGVLAIADRVAMLNEGQLIFDGSPDEARASEIPAVRQFVHGLTEGPL